MARYNHEDAPSRSRVDGSSWESLPGLRRASGVPARKVAPAQKRATPTKQAPSSFSGKRHSRRFPAVLPVEIRSPYLMLRGETADLSRDGFRALLSEASISRLGDAHNALGLYEMIERHFADGLEAFFPRHGVRAPARVIRLLTTPKGGTDIYLGFRFSNPLSEQDWSKLFDKDE